MNKQELIDNFINERKGIPPAGASMFEINGIKFTLGVFKQRSKELGWINGYKWGKEYPTNGKKPDLPDGINIALNYKKQHVAKSINHLTDSYKYTAWDLTKSFRIVDQRYKPKEPESHGKPSVDGAKSKPDNSWHERGELPPVGVECEVIGEYGDDNYYKCYIVGRDIIDDAPSAVFRISDYKCVKNYYSSSSAKWFRPTKTEREKFVEAAIGLNIGRYIITTQAAADAYDAGFRKPDNKGE